MCVSINNCRSCHAAVESGIATGIALVIFKVSAGGDYNMGPPTLSHFVTPTPIQGSSLDIPGYVCDSGCQLPTPYRQFHI